MDDDFERDALVEVGRDGAAEVGVGQARRHVAVLRAADGGFSRLNLAPILATGSFIPKDSKIAGLCNRPNDRAS